MAEVGDWVVGTGEKSHESGGHRRLIYAMRITLKIPLHRFVTSPQYVGRADRFPGSPHTAGRFALISDEFWYFGRNAIDVSRIPLDIFHTSLKCAVRAAEATFLLFVIADFETWIR
jgi:hypothetical protein